MGQELVIPDSFKGKAMAGAFAAAGLNAMDDNLSEGIGQSYGVMGYRGKVWSLRYRGERHNILRPDDGTPVSFIDVIILGQAKQKSKSYYKKFEPGTSDGDRPLCSSIDGLVPDADVVQKQCDSCALCPRNEWKQQPNGKKGRECTDYKRLAVLLLPTLTKPILGQPLMEPVFLRVPPDSLNSLAIMGETMANQGHHYSSYITRISFDPQKPHPCMVFRPIQGLTDAEAPVILEMRKHDLVDRIILGSRGASNLQVVDESHAMLPAGSAPTGLVAPASSAVATPPSTIQPSGEPQTSTFATTTSAPPATPPAAPSPSPSGLTSGLTDTGFGGATPASTAPTPPAASQTAADAGEPEESDADLDARIASLIKRPQ